MVQHRCCAEWGSHSYRAVGCWRTLRPAAIYVSFYILSDCIHKSKAFQSVFHLREILSGVARYPIKSKKKARTERKSSGADFRCVFLLSLGERVLLTLISVWMGQGGQSIVAIANANPSACRNHHLAEALVVCALVIRIVFSCMGQCVLLSGMVGYDKAHTAHKPEVAQGSRSCIG